MNWLLRLVDHLCGHLFVDERCLRCHAIEHYA